MWNASILRKGGLLPQSEVVARYVQLCEEYDNPFGNSKYTVLQMLDGGGKTAAYRMLQQVRYSKVLGSTAHRTHAERAAHLAPHVVAG